MISDYKYKINKEAAWYGLNINSRQKVLDYKKFKKKKTSKKMWYNKMYESISKNNELENEMTLDMSYFWYSDEPLSNHWLSKCLSL